MESNSSKNILGRKIGVFKRNSQNIETCILSKLLYRFQPNFVQWWRPPNALRGWSKHPYYKSKMADSHHFEKKNRKIALFQQRFDRSPWNLV